MSDRIGAMRYQSTESSRLAVATDLTRPNNPSGVAIDRSMAAAPDAGARRWMRALGLCCYLAAGLMLAGAVILPIVTFAIFVFWLKTIVGALLGDIADNIGLGSGASPVGQVFDVPGHDPTGIVLLVAVIGSAVASGLAIAAFVLLCTESFLIIGALGLFLIGRRLRRGPQLSRRPTLRAAGPIHR